MATPPWNSRHNSTLGDASAMADAADVNQLLGTHAQTMLYSSVNTLTPTGTGAGLGVINLASTDIDQPFTLATSTSIGRVVVPLLAVGDGADLLVSVCQDNAGVPGTLINQTRLPASFTAQLGASNGLDNAGPVTTAANNTMLYSGWQTVPWSAPATGPTGGLSTAQLAQSGDYFVFAGGLNNTNGNPTANVAVITWTGDDTISAPVPGPQLPQAVLAGGFTATPDSLCYVGGVTYNGSTYTVQSTVYLAAWDPSAGTIGTWSVQQPLPHTLADPGVAAYAATDTVYVVGGSTNYAPETGGTSNVYYSTVTNQQVTAWTSAPSLPSAVIDPTVAVIGDWLIVVGGFNAGGTGLTSVYYAPINTTTGVPGNWLNGPSVPGSLYVEGTTATTNNAILWPQAVSPSTGIAVADTLTLTWDDHGPGVWSHQIPALAVNNADQVTAAVETGNGVYQIFNFQSSGVAYTTAQVLTVPMIPVPVPITGLTLGTTYHILLQQQGGDLNDYLTTLTDSAVFSSSPTALTSARQAYTWTAAGPTGTAVPLIVANASVTSPSVGNINLPLDIWDDNGLRITSIVRNTSPDQALIGLCEATAMVTAANVNTGFETTLTPWTATGGTLARSQTQVYEGFWSAQLTPSGSASTSFMSSELLDCLPGQSITISGFVWCTTAVTTDFSMSINWYTSGNVYINTSSNNISIPAQTWTFVTNTFTATTSGGGAYRYTLNPALSGTPAASNVMYFNLVIGYPTYVCPQLSGVAQINYPVSTWPGINPTKPTGITVLA